MEELKKANELHEFEIKKYQEVIEILKIENARYREVLKKSCKCIPGSAYSIHSEKIVMLEGHMCPACEALKENND